MKQQNNISNQERSNERTKSKRKSDHAQDKSESGTRRGTVTSFQQTAGNQAIQRLVDQGIIQPNLEVSSPSDAAEREAELVAEEVMRMSPSESGIESREDAGIQREAKGEDTATIDGETKQQIESVKGGGKSLPPAARSFFEPRFERGFSDVRVHTGPKADEVARSIDAEAFTYGTDVVFRKGEYDPNSQEGKKLLAHELTHVAQQNQGRGAPIQRQDSNESKEKSPGENIEGDSAKLKAENNEKQVNDFIDKIAGEESQKFHDQMKTAAESFENWYQGQTLSGGSYSAAGLEVLGAAAAITAAVLPPTSAVAGVSAASVATVKALTTVNEEAKKHVQMSANEKALGIEQGAINKAEGIRDIYQPDNSYGAQVKEKNYSAWWQIGHAVVMEQRRDAEQMIYNKAGVPDVSNNLETRVLSKMIERFKEYKENQDLMFGPAPSPWKGKRYAQTETEEMEESRSQARSQLGKTEK